MFQKLISIILTLILSLSQAVAAVLPGKNTEVTLPEATGTYTGLDYSRDAAWSFRQDSGKDADVFLIAPTVTTGFWGQHTIDLRNWLSRELFDSAVRGQIGLYAGECNIYAPYYRQATLQVYAKDDATREAALSYGYKDISAAFRWYMENRNDGKPFVLAGFSQGADMTIRLIKEYFGDEALRSQLVAVYAIGWAVTEEDLAECEWLQMAQGEKDTGVVISFECEAEGKTSSLVVKEGTRMLSINPLTWSTGTDYADAALNMGSCFTDSRGFVCDQTDGVTGAYIDPERGTLICTDLDPREYPTYSWYFTPGEYHLYDYQLFYRNLQQNVTTRLTNFVRQSVENTDSSEVLVLAAFMVPAVPILLLLRRRKHPAQPMPV